MAKNYVRENVPLSRFGVLVAQLESIVASAAHKPPDALLCFDLLSDLISAIEEEPKESILLWQRKCEDALYSLVVLGARRPVRHLASLAMARIISRGDGISVYSRASSLQGFLADGKRSEPLRAAGAAKCLGELYHHFGRKITSGLLETTNIVGKLLKFYEDFVRQEALELLHNALEGSGGNGASTAYAEAFRLITRLGVGDKSFIVRIAAARCLKAFANISGPGLGVAELEYSYSYCLKAEERVVLRSRVAYAAWLGSQIALGVFPLAYNDMKQLGAPRSKSFANSLTSFLLLKFWDSDSVLQFELLGLNLFILFVLHAMQLKHVRPDGDLANFALHAIEMLHGDSTVDAHALACVLYILRVGVIDHMTETNQRSFLVLLGSQLESHELSPSMKVAVLHTVSHILTTLGEVPPEFKEILDNTVVASLSHSALLVRIEAALTLRALAEVDPTCVGGLISYAVTTFNALRESISFEKGTNLKVELDSLHGQASVISALVSISPKLPLGYPARLPETVLEVSKKMLTESSRNPMATSVDKEAGWLLLGSLLASMPREDLEDQVFDVLSLWATLFSGNPEYQIRQAGDLTSQIQVWSVAVEALTSFINCFISPAIDAPKTGILLQPVLMYLSRALSYISFLAAKQLPDARPAMDLFTIRTLMAYQSLSDPMAYKNDHSQLMQLCTTPFREPSGCEESSCLQMLLDKRDAWLGPWIPGRDWFEDELRAFQGGKDGLMPCVWEKEIPAFPQPVTTSKMLVNQMLLCFGILLATKDNGGIMLLLGMIERCLKAGKKQSWHNASLTNACVGLLAALKSLLALRPQSLEVEVLSSVQAIFQGILSEGDISAAHRRASSEGLGLLARLGNDVFTARMTRSLLGDLVAATDLNYSGSIALSLGCIHRSAGGMALSTLVPATVHSISLLAKSANAGLQIWSLHGLLLTIEAAGLSFVSQVQATLLLALEILLADENGLVDLRQGIGRLINAVVAVLGPELAPGSIFFSRCKSVVSEISAGKETSTVLESVRFTQQLVLFAPQAVSVHIHLKTLLPTLSSGQRNLRHLAISTLRHLIETNPISIIEEHIEENLFHMLDEETDLEIGNLIRATIKRLLYKSCPSCPSHWMSVCRSMILAVPTRKKAYHNNSRSNDPAVKFDRDRRLYYSDDDENMVSNAAETDGSIPDSSGTDSKRESHLRYRTRIFAAECLNHLPTAVGNDSAHFDLSLARKLSGNGNVGTDWLVLHLQELISLAYQISTIQFENIQPIGVHLLCIIIEKFENVPDPELPGHFLLEQYQAQFVSAVRTALSASSGPLLLEAGLHLATKILTSSITRGDQSAVKRIFSLISRPLDDFKDLYYPSFAEWVACKIRIRLLAAHAFVKSYIYAFLKQQKSQVSDEYLALLPHFSKNSITLGNYWIYILRDYSYLCFRMVSETKYKPFLEGIQSPSISSKLQQFLDESWHVVLQAVTLDALPVQQELEESSKPINPNSILLSGYKMVELDPREFQFLWGFALFVLFQGHNSMMGSETMPLFHSHNAKVFGYPVLEGTKNVDSEAYVIAIHVIQSLSAAGFLSVRYLNVNACKELFQVLAFSIQLEDSLTGLVVSIISQIVQACCEDYFAVDDFASIAMELCITCLHKMFQSTEIKFHIHLSDNNLLTALFATMEKLVDYLRPQLHLRAILALLSTIYNCLKGSSSEIHFTKVANIFQLSVSLLKNYVMDQAKDINHSDNLIIVFGAWQNSITSLTDDCINSLHLLQNKMVEASQLLKLKLAFFLEQTYFLAKLVYETQSCLENDNALFLCTLYGCCIQCLKTSINDSNIQVQAVGLQVLKSIAQRELAEGSNSGNQSFFMFFCGEHFLEIVNLIQRISKKPASKDSVIIAGECLKFLFLIQTLSKVTEHQGTLVNLLLEVIVMVVSASDSELSQEFIEIRNIAFRFVSHLAQVASSAVLFRDVLLAMPATNRQRLQDIIRASVNQDRVFTKPAASPPSIKLPVQVEPSTSSNSQVHATESLTFSDNDDMEENDDWDAFQSFPADADVDADVNQENSNARDNHNDNFEMNGHQPSEDVETNSETHDSADNIHEVHLLSEENELPEFYNQESIENAAAESSIHQDRCEVSETIKHKDVQLSFEGDEFIDDKVLSDVSPAEDNSRNKEDQQNDENDVSISDPSLVRDEHVSRLEPQVASDSESSSDNQKNNGQHEAWIGNTGKELLFHQSLASSTFAGLKKASRSYDFAGRRYFRGKKSNSGIEQHDVESTVCRSH
ncbi:hypothetical protein Syun_022916 [Stephania yunnanensis]|uniref:HEAT repeat-containing protein 5B n=1 Tax=Stephania yunnanensis TaxID=152371 RepID=A0AAP0I350_9MAGN